MPIGNGSDRMTVTLDRVREWTRDSHLSIDASDPRLVEALEEYLRLQASGQPYDRETFLANHPDVAEALAECLDGLARLESAAHAVESLPGTIEILRPSTVLGDFRILRELGRGGMGVVYEAHQISLGRRVALKVLPFAAALDPRQRQRFQVEAQAAAHLHHSNIVPIFAVGCDRGTHYYAMQYVDGWTLATVIADLRREAGESDQKPADPPSAPPPSSPSWPFDSTITHPTGPETALPTSSTPPQTSPPGSTPRPASSSHRAPEFYRWVAQLGMQASEALDHAHGLGIVHRDIKPGNLMVDTLGNLWVTDFGLARFLDEPGMTRTGDVLGTLRYMSPEQALARHVVVDQRTDLYSLGATLYELVTLQPPFTGNDRRELLRQLAFDEPIPPRQLRPTIPRDLETIVLKAMAKEVGDRYVSARDLADDLRRFRDDQPIAARRPGPAERSLRWARRHRGLLSALGGIIVVASIVGASVAFAAQNRLRLTNNELNTAKGKLESAVRDLQVLNTQNQEARKNLEAMVERQRKDRDVITLALDAVAQNAMQGFYMDDPAARERNENFARYVLGFYEKVLPSVEDDPALRMLTHYRIGFTQGPLLRQNEDAEVHFRKALAIFDDPANTGLSDVEEAASTASFACLQLAFMEARRGHLEQSLEFAQRAAAIDEHRLQSQPNSASTLHSWVQTQQRIASSLRALNRPQDAAQRIDQAWNRIESFRIEQLPTVSDPSTRSILASIYTYLAPALAAYGQPDLQTKAQEIALELRPDDANLANSLAWDIVRRPVSDTPQIERAVQLAEQAVSAAPSNAAYQNTLGIAYLRAGRLDEAEAALNRSIEHSQGGSPIDWLALAILEHERGQTDAARSWFNRAVEHQQESKGTPDADTRRFFEEATQDLGLEDVPAFLDPPPQSPGSE